MYFIVREDEFGGEMFFAGFSFPALSNMKFSRNVVCFIPECNILEIIEDLQNLDVISSFDFHKIEDLPKFLHIMA